ncbi:thioredoxin family protein [Histidinibacterium aquaticum]|uniref:Thioredoxin family protein n=1 Tax=Histidinibacterium aquaticum TaxID=2613962 RepID=A0A5J5GBU9_9RHOB|nr:thioredoxin family protein [Histidinibacterium aquaticum]KAA9005282.1 thioredoxin family protein [Histidinibacterium aquaticum]
MAATPPVCDFGWKAPDFRLWGTDDHPYELSGLKGENGLVLAFICNHCPYVKAVIDRIVRDAGDLAPLGIGFAAICSNDPEQYPEDSYENMQRFAKEHKFFFPYLHDPDQEVAKAYGAACTPDFFGFNGDLELQYRGRLDSSGKSAEEGARRELFEAMEQVAKTGEGPRDQTPSIGCSIKWKAA